jgi:hypothetical protein
MVPVGQESQAGKDEWGEGVFLTVVERYLFFHSNRCGQRDVLPEGMVV